MTREEAKTWLDRLYMKADITDEYGDMEDMQPYEEALDIAIERLEQQPKTGHWIVQPSNKEQGERDFIWWKCSECGQVIYSETEKDRKEFHAFCGRCGAKMIEPQEGSNKE